MSIKFRSRFEETVAAWLTKHGIKYKYEAVEIEHWHKLRVSKCGDCDSNNVLQLRRYITDFSFPQYKFFVETKGHFTGKDRTKMLDVKAAGHVVYMVFQRDNRLNPTSRTHYSDWCDQHDIAWSIGLPKLAWFKQRSKK